MARKSESRKKAVAAKETAADVLEAEVVEESAPKAQPEVAINEPPVSSSMVVAQQPRGLQVAGTPLTIEGMHIPPDQVADEQFRRWHAAYQKEKADFVGHASQAVAYAYLMGRALSARRDSIRKARTRNWLQWLATIGIPESTAYDYIDVFKIRKRQATAGQSSDASELAKPLRRILTDARQATKQGKPQNPTAPGLPPPVDSAVPVLTKGDEHTREEILELVKAAASPTSLAHAVVLGLLAAYGKPSWGLQLRQPRPGAPLPKGQPAAVLLPTTPTPAPTAAVASIVPMPSRSLGQNLKFVEKYRPMKFADVVGQDAAIKQLQSYPTSEAVMRVLLVGPSGSGKTTLAWILARGWVCEDKSRTSPDPCGTCETCVNTGHLDTCNFWFIKQVSAAAPMNSVQATKGVVDLLGTGSCVIINEAEQLKDAVFGTVQMLDLNRQTSAIFTTCDIEPLSGKDGQFLNRVDVVRLKEPSHEDVAAVARRVAATEGIALSEDEAMALAIDEDGVLSPRQVLNALERLRSAR